MKKIVIGLIIILIIIAIYLYLEVTTLEVSKYNVKSDKLPEAFDGYKVAHISDFHNTKSNRLKNKILQTLEKDKPDILVITGDFIDSRRTNMQVSLAFIEKIKDIPIYYVAGNHESRIKDYPKFKKELQNLGVKILENEKIELTQKTDSISLIGLQDPSFDTNERDTKGMTQLVDKWLKSYSTKDKFEILLLHRPELFTTYVENHVDVVFSGHAHGGQVILPFIGPIIAPNQGYFPKYTSGVHTKDNTNLVISRGIGNSLCPIRINNNPELVYVILKKN